MIKLNSKNNTMWHCT